MLVQVMHQSGATPSVLDISVVDAHMMV